MNKRETIKKIDGRTVHETVNGTSTTEGNEMFYQEFDNMFADVWFDERDRAYASEEGVGDFEAGANTMHSNDALIAVRKYDRALRGNHYAAKRNRLRAQRNSLVTAFGPEMAERVGYA